jgi:hypothetical protein
MHHWALPLWAFFLIQDRLKAGVCEKAESLVCVQETSSVLKATPQINSHACIFNQHHVIASFSVKHRGHKILFDLDEFGALNFKKPQIIKIGPSIPSDLGQW